MKKGTVVVGVVALVAVAYLGSTWYVGKEAQKTIEDVIVKANQRLVTLLGPDLNRSGMKVEINDYQRRFFSSDVVYTFHMKDENGKPLAISLKDHLQHGPFPLGALQDGHLGPLLAHSRAELIATPATQAWIDSQQGGSPLIIESQVGFGGKGQSVWTFAPTEFKDDTSTFSFSGATVDMDFSNDFNDNSATGQFDALSVIDNETQESMHLKNFKFDSATVGGMESKVQVNSAATIDAVTLNQGSDNAFSFENMTASFDSTQTGDIVDGALRYDFGRMTLAGRDLGSASVGGKIQRLDIAALTALANEYEAAKARHGVQNDEDLELTDEDEALLREKLLAVLASDPAVSIDPLVWKNDKGQSSATLYISLVGPNDPKEQDVDVLLGQVLKQVKFDFSVSKPMLLQALSQAQIDEQQGLQLQVMAAMIYDQYVSRLQTLGLVKVEADTTASSITYENDSVNVNGEAMPVTEFMQRAMSLVM